MGSAVGLRVLLLTEEESTLGSFGTVCNELGIEAVSSPQGQDMESHLREQQYAAVVVDFDNPDAAEKYLSTLQQSPANRTAVVVAVSGNAKNLERALQCRAHFVLRRPFEIVEVRRTLRAAYDFMFTHQRRPFRCSTVLPVRLRMVRSGATFECSTINVSSNGVAVCGSMRIKQFDSVDVEVVLPDGFVLLATGIVVWDDKHGKCGINFQVRTPEIRRKLDSWLAAQEASLAKGELICKDFSAILPGGTGKSQMLKEENRT